MSQPKCNENGNKTVTNSRAKRCCGVGRGAAREMPMKANVPVLQVAWHDVTAAHAWAKCEAVHLAPWHLHTLQRAVWSVQRAAVKLPQTLSINCGKLMLRSLHAHNHRLPPQIGLASLRSSRHRLHMQHGASPARVSKRQQRLNI